jgi:hypothetical protein
VFGIDQGPSTQENTQYGNLTSTSGFAANAGEGDLTASSDFMKSILSGDPAKIGQVLGPQIRAIQGQGQQKKQTLAQFGNRGGGTNATAQTIGDNTRSSINDMISSLTGSAVSGLNNTGQNLLGMGMSGFGTAFGEANTMQQQRAAKWNDIFSSIGDTAGMVAGFPGIGKGLSQGLDSVAGAFGS